MKSYELKKLPKKLLNNDIYSVDFSFNLIRECAYLNICTNLKKINLKGNLIKQIPFLKNLIHL